MKALKKLFSGTKSGSNEPELGTMYAVTGGAYLGEFFVFVEKVSGVYMFLSLPNMEVRAVPAEKYKLGVHDKVLDLIDEELPSDILDVCLAQYRKSKTDV